MLTITKIKVKREQNQHVAKYYLYRFKKYIKKKRFWNTWRCWGRSIPYIDYHLSKTWPAVDLLLKKPDLPDLPAANLTQKQQTIDFVNLHNLKYNIWTGNSSNLRLGPVVFDHSLRCTITQFDFPKTRGWWLWFQ